MTEVGPSIPHGAIEDFSGNRILFLSMVLAVAVLLQLMVAIKNKI
jgi:hypothetical protein